MSDIERGPELSKAEPEMLASGYVDPNAGFMTPEAILADLSERLERKEITDIDAYNAAAILGIVPEK